MPNDTLRLFVKTVLDDDHGINMAAYVLLARLADKDFEELQPMVDRIKVTENRAYLESK